MIVPMPILFPACVGVLARGRLPMHYKSLTDGALVSLGVDRQASAKDRCRMAEDVREKLAEKGNRGTAYLGSPDFLVVMRDWFDRQPTLFSPDLLAVSGDARAGIAGGVEFVMRAPHMLNKQRTADDPVRVEAGVRGLVIEKHVAGFFRQGWPNAYRDATNAHDYRRPCNHDFRLRFRGRWWEVDVAGPKRTGYGLAPGKPAADFHLLSRIDGRNVIIDAIQTGEKFGAHHNPLHDISPLRLVVRLNCEARGLDYDDIAARASEVTR